MTQTQGPVAFEPVRATPAVLAVLEATYGRDQHGKLIHPGWLLWVSNRVEDEEILPTRFDAPVPHLMLAGSVERVELGEGDAVTVGGRDGLSSLRALHEAASGPWSHNGDYYVLPAVRALKYVHVVADRHDEDGMRVERFVGARCRMDTLSMWHEEITSQIEATSFLRWWRAGPSGGSVMVQHRRFRDDESVAGLGDPSRWPW